MTTPPYNDAQVLLRSFIPSTNSIRVTDLNGGGGGSGGGLLAGVVFDAIVASYPNSTTEVYEYKEGGVSGTVNATVTVVYVDSTKAAIVSVVKT